MAAELDTTIVKCCWTHSRRCVIANVLIVIVWQPFRTPFKLLVSRNYRELFCTVHFLARLRSFRRRKYIKLVFVHNKTGVLVPSKHTIVGSNEINDNG